MSFKFSGKNNIDALLKKQYWNSVGKAVKLTYSITGFNKKRNDFIGLVQNVHSSVLN